MRMAQRKTVNGEGATLERDGSDQRVPAGTDVHRVDENDRGSSVQQEMLSQGSIDRVALRIQERIAQEAIDGLDRMLHLGGSWTSASKPGQPEPLAHDERLQHQP